MENRTEHIKQLITNSETNIVKTMNISETKEISEFNDTDKEIIQTLIKDLKELGKDKMKDNDTYKEFRNLDDEFYLFNIKDIIEKGSKILKDMKHFYGDLFLDEPPRIKIGKGGFKFKRETRR